MSDGADPTGHDPEALLDAWLADARAVAPHAERFLLVGEGELLLNRWTEPHRSYHTLEHLTELLAAVDQLLRADALSVRQARLARVAGWYHDVVHDPRALPGSNEHRSATLARDHLHRLGADRQDIDLVERAVLMTAGHQVAHDAAPEHLPVLDAVHDADLWILSAPPGRYAAYRTQVRAEYAHVPDADFRRGRAAVMAPYLERTQIYRTGHAHRDWTEQARANLSAELAELIDEV